MPSSDASVGTAYTSERSLSVARGENPPNPGILNSGTRFASTIMSTWFHANGRGGAATKVELLRPFFFLSLCTVGRSQGHKEISAMRARPSAGSDMTDEDHLLNKAYAAASGLARACDELRSFNTSVGRDPAGHLVNYLMTELWDHGFSQSEIRTAFTDALSDLNRYAAGEERRSQTSD